MGNATHHQERRRGLAAWAEFVAGALLLTGAVLVLMQGYTPPGPLGAVFRNNLRDGIDATALFYTESEVSYEAEATIRHAMRLSADRADRPAALTRDGIDRSSTRR